MRILYVEDNPTVRLWVAQTMGDAGHEVISIDTPEHALDMLPAIAPKLDLVVTDIDLGSEIDGWHIARTARARSRSIPVINLSAAQDCPDKRVANSTFLRKPCHAAVLEQVIAGLCGERRRRWGPAVSNATA